MTWLIPAAWAVSSAAAVYATRGLGKWWKVALVGLAAPFWSIGVACYRAYRDIKKNFLNKKTQGEADDQE